MTTDEKYIVFKRKDWSKFAGSMELGLVEIEDAVVIRKQDIFAPPALEGYANAIQCVIEALEFQMPPVKQYDLRKIADYFQAQANDAYEMKRKLPD